MALVGVGVALVRSGCGTSEEEWVWHNKYGIFH